MTKGGSVVKCNSAGVTKVTVEQFSAPTIFGPVKYTALCTHLAGMVGQSYVASSDEQGNAFPSGVFRLVIEPLNPTKWSVVVKP